MQNGDRKKHEHIKQRSLHKPCETLELSLQQQTCDAASWVTMATIQPISNNLPLVCRPMIGQCNMMRHDPTQQ